MTAWTAAAAAGAALALLLAVTNGYAKSYSP